MNVWYKRILVSSLMCLGGLLVGGCGAPSFEDGKMGKFESEADFQGYMNHLGFLFQQNNANSMVPGTLGQTASQSDNNKSSSRNETITNNQEQGVDEGDIVKNIGDHLLVLRKGRLYAVKVRGAGVRQQTDSIRVAPSEDLNRNVWYDEMLVKGNTIYVIGYRYITRVDGADQASYDWIRGATEVSSFLLQQGKLVRKKTLFLQSHDYYSSENYTSRLVNGKLIFYMPFSAFRWISNGNGIWSFRRHKLTIPYFLTHKEGQTFSAIKPMFTWKEVIRPVQKPNHPTFHTVVSCDLPTSGEFNCKAKSLLGEYSREFYVSPSSIYLWSLPYVYSFNMKTLSASVHAARGKVRNQFAFKEKDGNLYVMVTRKEGILKKHEHLELLHLSLDQFNQSGQQTWDETNHRVLSENYVYLTIGKIRYVDGWFLADYYNHDADKSSYNFIAAHIHGGTPEISRRNAPLTRIEAMPGVGALLVGTYNGTMQLDILKLGKTTKLEPSLRLQAVQEGETRSHGFFFKPSKDGGVFGLPVVNPNGQGSRWYGRGVSNIAFFRSTSAGKLSLLGAASSSPASEGQCETSCVDWYGNTRPIFLGDQIFALMGSELQELTLTGTKVQTKGNAILLQK
ncbi:MAG: hypothetical protein EP343_27865 [Deltaproteobacteria bacterium]|nr:MAG: hypothetical protein EP343_27865 [Deltaproteobacteria bacterium]